MKIVPVDVIITRFYRAYAHVPDNATDAEVRKSAIEQIIEEQDKALTPDPDIEIEECDFQEVRIDHEGSWSEEEDKEISRILNETKEA